jgi:uncharacterized protein (DUF1697 family)
LTYLALLRGVNVGGNKMVAMADLRRVLTAMGYDDVTTVLQSGNIVFSGKAAKATAVETRLETAIEKQLGLRADFHVRTAAEWHAVVAANPFADEATKDPGHLLVYCFKAPLDGGRVEALRTAITGRERLKADGRHLYMTFPDGMGDSKAAPLVDRMLGVRGTARNWNTVLKLAALAAR